MLTWMVLLALVTSSVVLVQEIHRFWARRTGALRARLRHRVVVTLKSGAAFDGVLYEADTQVWVLRNVTALGAGDRDTNVPVDGEVLLLVADIAYAQRP